MLTCLSVLCAYSTRRGARVLTGVLIGLATLTKIYPIVLLVAIPRLRDWAVLVAWVVTMVLGYLPFLILGHGQVLGFLPTYIREQGWNAGVVPYLVSWNGSQFGLPLDSIMLLECAVDLVLLSAVGIIARVLRLRDRMSMEASTLLLISTVFAVSSHVFPWYVSTLVPWIALLISPLWIDNRPSGKGLAIAMAWYFTVVVLLGYVLNTPSGWHTYYVIAYGTVMVGLLAAAAIAVMNARAVTKTG